MMVRLEDTRSRKNRGKNKPFTKTNNKKTKSSEREETISPWLAGGRSMTAVNNCATADGMMEAVGSCQDLARPGASAAVHSAIQG